MSKTPERTELELQVDALRLYHPEGVAEIEQRAREVWEARLRDFMDYYEPKGGVSDVPLGPFERAIEVLGGCSRCGGAPLNHKQWCDDPTEGWTPWQPRWRSRG